MTEVTVGIDIGTTSVKAVAADGDGKVVEHVRVRHGLGVPAPDRFEHDPEQAWRRGVRRALREVSRGLDAAMVAHAAAHIPLQLLASVA